MTHPSRDTRFNALQEIRDARAHKIERVRDGVGTRRTAAAKKTYTQLQQSLRFFNLRRRSLAHAVDAVRNYRHKS